MIHSSFRLKVRFNLTDNTYKVWSRAATEDVRRLIEEGVSGKVTDQTFDAIRYTVAVQIQEDFRRAT